MAILPWRNALEVIRPHVAKVMTPRGSGTVFLCAYAKDRSICAIATAAHVVQDCHSWEEPIRVRHYMSGKERLLRANDRLIWFDHELDTAVVLFPRHELPFPRNTLLFISEGSILKVGVEVGWVGFPVVSPNNLCFFTGTTSCWMQDSKTYLVDGAAINGVSGGPAFYRTSKGIKVIGSVTAYLPNMTAATPGLAMISDVDQFQRTIRTLRDWEEAKGKGRPSTEASQENQDRGTSA